MDTPEDKKPIGLGGSDEVVSEEAEMFLASISATGKLFKQQEGKVKKR